MSFKRILFPAKRPEPLQLNRLMAGIGMGIAAQPDFTANIEDVVFYTSHEGLEGDLRTLRVLTNWLEIHHKVLIVDRLTRLVFHNEQPLFRAYWTAVALWLERDTRFRRLAQAYTRERLHLTELSAFHLERHGENQRFANGPLIVPTTLLARRDGDAAPPYQVARFHPYYRRRLQMGATYRSDMWAELELNQQLTPAQLARRCYGTFATAWRAKQDFDVLTRATRDH